MKEIKTILFALDISDVSEYAFGYAAAMAESFGAKLAVIHVVHHQTDLRNYYVPEISFDNVVKRYFRHIIVPQVCLVMDDVYHGELCPKTFRHGGGISERIFRHIGNIQSEEYCFNFFHGLLLICPS